ncbi:MAG: hypothetical protein RIT40_1045, partial [Planctomycetota bacterium]
MNDQASLRPSLWLSLIPVIALVGLLVLNVRMFDSA